MAFEPPLVAALNHLLDAEPWARERLVAFAESVLEVRPAALPPMRLAITSDGRLRPAPPGEPASLVLSFGPEALPAMLKGEDHLLRAVQADGDSRLASEVLFLVRYLRWDAEEDMSKVLGDVAAHRLAATARGFFDSQRQALSRTAESVIDYLLEERQLVTHAAAFEEHRVALARLRDAIESLEKRLERLAG